MEINNKFKKVKLWIILRVPRIFTFKICKILVKIGCFHKIIVFHVEKMVVCEDNAFYQKKHVIIFKLK